MARLHVRDLMSDHVITLDREDDLTKVFDTLSTAHIRHLPVVNDEGVLEGLVTERDLLRFTGSLGSRPVGDVRDALRRARVTDVMTEDVETVGPDDDVGEAARLMRENQLGCLPVVEGETLAGIITESDFVEYFVPGTGATSFERVTRPEDEDGPLQYLEAHVSHGHLVLDVPIDLPEGTLVNLAIADDVDALEQDLAAPPSPEPYGGRAPGARTELVQGEELNGIVEGD